MRRREKVESHRRLQAGAGVVRLAAKFKRNGDIFQEKSVSRAGMRNCSALPRKDVGGGGTESLRQTREKRHERTE